jgi:NAD(P)-dependent dehydrogenase (short-subunit alcohol dehydrogenase family)
MADQLMDDYSQPSLEGKVAIITGAGQGVGRGIAEIFAQRRVNLVVTGRTSSKLESLREELGDSTRVELVPGDVGSRDDVNRAVETAVEAYGGIDILVNNAQSLTSVTFNEPLLSISDETIEVPFRSGLLGSLYFMQACYPHLKARGGGSIVNFGSATAVHGMPGFGAYAIAKEGIRGLTRIAAKEWGPDNVRVNTITPAALTERLNARLDEDPAAKEASFARIPLRRLGDPARDIGRAVAALVGEDLSYLTPATISLDGGVMLIN